MDADPRDQRIRELEAENAAKMRRCNNRAERALRPAVVARKLSCGNKTERGVRTWETFASLTATCAQQGRSIVDFLAPKLRLQPTGAAR